MGSNIFKSFSSTNLNLASRFTTRSGVFEIVEPRYGTGFKKSVLERFKHPCGSTSSLICLVKSVFDFLLSNFLSYLIGVAKLTRVLLFNCLGKASFVLTKSCVSFSAVFSKLDFIAGSLTVSCGPLHFSLGSDYVSGFNFESSSVTMQSGF